uniref:Uncharacterized protein n=1 Tax=Leersia perrieri TaxID=77586 RepID=A0A0D9X458_9ORYZ
MTGSEKKNQQSHPSNSSAAAAADAESTRPAMTTPVAEYKRAHDELMAEAAAMAAECEVDVHVIAFLPGGDCATKHTFLGAPTASMTAAKAAAEEAKRNQAAKKKATLMAFVGKDVSKMTMEEAKTHHEKLMNLRTNVIRKLQQKTAAAAATSVVGDGDEDGDGHCNKIRKIDS